MYFGNRVLKIYSGGELRDVVLGSYETSETANVNEASTTSVEEEPTENK